MMFEDYFVYEVTIGFLVVICLMLVYINRKLRKENIILKGWDDIDPNAKIRERHAIQQAHIKEDFRKKEIELRKEIESLKFKLEIEKRARQKALKIIEDENAFEEFSGSSGGK